MSQYQGIIRFSKAADPERSVSLEELVAEARQTAAAGHLEQAFELLYRAIRLVEDMGFPQVALLLVDKLYTVLDVDQLEPRNKAWLLNSKGLALQSLGRIKEAAQTLNDMRKLGETLDDKQIVATSLMNLGTQALMAGNTEAACELWNRSLTINHEIGQYRAATQIRLNLASAYIQAGDLREAEAQLSVVQEFVEMWKDPHLLATFYGNVGTISAKHGYYDIARKNYEMALKNARRTGDLSAKVNTLQNLGALNLDEGLPSKAMHWFRRALKIAETTGSLASQEAIFAGLAMTFHRVGRRHEAAESFEKARRIAEQMGDRLAKARYTADLGAILLSAKEIKLAKSLLQEALDIFKEIGDQEWEYRVLRNMIEVHWASGNLEASMKAVELALAALKPESHAERAELFGRAAQIWLGDRERLEQASYYYNRQLSEYEKQDEVEALAWHSALAGAALAEAGGTNLSIPFYSRSIELYKSLSDNHMIFHALNDRANAFSDLGRYQEALTDYEVCMNLADKLDDRVMRLQTSLNWGETARRRGKIREAISKLNKAVSLSRKLADRESEAESLANLGIALSDAKQWDNAQSTFRLARNVARAAKHPSAEASAIGGLARIAFVKGRFKTAAKLYEKAARLSSTGKSNRQFLEDLAGLVESLAAAGRNLDIEREAQRLVDVAQKRLETELASESLMRAARWFLKRNELEDAASLYAAGIAITGVGLEEDLINRLSKACLMMAFHVQMDAKEQEEFYEQVISQLNNNYKGIGENLRNLVSLARQQAAQFDNIRQ
jgi:tetratricopeptide (TPR) repeat protein